MIPYVALLATALLLLPGEGHCSDPCQTISCPAGEFCVSVVPNCAQPPCARVGFCVSSVSPAICPALVCPQPCQVDQIRRFDSAGCKTCDCFDPCQGVQCGRDQECVAQANDSCIQAVCVDKLICIGWTEPHYETNDGASIYFQGVGLYVMSQFTSVDQVRCDGLRDFQVLVDQEYRYGRPDVSYIRSVTLVLPGIVVLNIGQNRQLTVISGAIPATMSITTLTIPPSPPFWRRVTVLRIETSFGLVVQFDGDMWASVILPLAYRNCIEGLCGNADGIPVNDLRTQLGEDVSMLPLNMMYWAIGNSWRVIDVFPPAILDRVRRSVDGDGESARLEIAPLTGKEQSEDSRDLSCTDDMMGIVDELCGSLQNKGGPLGEAIMAMPERAKSIYNGCKYDVCALKDDMELARSLAQASIDTFVAISAAKGHLTEMTAAE